MPHQEDRRVPYLLSTLPPPQKNFKTPVLLVALDSHVLSDVASLTPVLSYSDQPVSQLSECVRDEIFPDRANINLNPEVIFKIEHELNQLHALPNNVACPEVLQTIKRELRMSRFQECTNAREYSRAIDCVD